MAHPLMFDPDEPCLLRLRELCLALPGADEKVAHGRPNFFTRRVFAIYGGSLKGDHFAPVARHAVLFLPDADDRPALLEDERFFVPAYVGVSGWLGLSFELGGGCERVDWDEVAELVDASYRNTAPARLVAELDARP
jgi:hypothetical protein